MKPTPLTTHNASRRDSLDFVMYKADRSPITDYNYHSISLESSSAKFVRPVERSFWNITDDYLKNEARHAFWGEAALFGILAVTALLPLISNAHALMEFARAISNY
jgi:hypothetical protein